MSVFRSVDDGYHGELPTDVWNQFDYVATDSGSGGVLAGEGSVDGQGGTIRGKTVFDIGQAAYYLNRGDGLIPYQGKTYESGAYWDGASGVGERWYDGAQSKTKAADAPLTTLTFGFYETTADILPIYGSFAGNAA